MLYLLKSHENLHGIPYRIKIMLKGIADSKTLDIAIKLYDPQTIYDSTKDPLESVET